MQVTITVQGKEELVQGGLVSADSIYEKIDGGGQQVFLNRADGIDIPLSLGEYLVIHGGEQFVVGESCIENNPPLRNQLRPKFNGSYSLALSAAKVTGKILKEQDDKFPQGRLFVDVVGGVDLEILDDMTILVQEADSYFVIPPAANSEGGSTIDIEECGKQERHPPKGHQYRIRIDGAKYIVESTEITGSNILGLAGKRPDEWSLNQKLHGGKRDRIAPSDLVDLTQPGIERFETIRKQAQQGSVYELPVEDLEYLDGNYPSKWKKVSEGGGKFGLIIESFPVPEGYTIGESVLMVLIPSGYPGSQLDMFYFSPPLSKLNGSSIRTLASETHFGRVWQRWSRHYTWQPGEDNIVSHIEYVKNELRNEVG